MQLQIEARTALRGRDRALSMDTDLTPLTAFAHRLLEAWAAWSYGEGRLGCTSFGRLFGLPSSSEAQGVLYLSEDQLLAIDAGIAKLDIAAQELIRVHYCSSDSEPMDVRYRRLGVTRTEYRERRKLMLAMLYQSLKPDVDRWRHLAI